MSQIVLSAVKREPGRTTAKALRREGLVPGVYYAKNQDPVHFSVQTLALRPIIYTAEAKMVALQVEGGKPLNCIVKDVTFDPISDKILHFDLLGVSAGQKMSVEMPIHLVGNSIGVRDGGAVEHVMHRAHVMVDPTNMPEHINVDISDLKIGHAIHISDVSIPGVEFTDRPEAVIVTCTAPKGSGDAAATEAAAS
ncbi:MAG: 50S ribosomal protein L25 ['Candidatus Kapabacteria' thiocyanatum]|uniref:Large ribosomal subunit protein bL25 n=1 Tax=Candidatus Kapaibacterium thiocyanatum TaxID=1895771 RepID=A0A1M3L6M5_9BACT|nr:50S ribosomal protein L25 ['Candidatus Kapabacteria' thiocyanatum]OJX61218.1 MAG: hypothetical protein BGO89_01120 ['Candidatus Kapabacteria' thiocyanatum]